MPEEKKENENFIAIVACGGYKRLWSVKTLGFEANVLSP